MRRIRNHKDSRLKRRKGSMVILMAAILSAVSVVCMMLVNTAYLEMARTDLQTATDLSVKAAANELGATQNTTKMEAAANQVMARHKIANGRSMTIARIERGSLGRDSSNDRYSLRTTGGSIQDPQSALRLVANYPSPFGNSMVPFPIPGSENLKVSREAMAGRTDIDLVLCLDRSASMAWGLSNVPFLYPNGTKGLDNYFRKPDSESSRWAAVRKSIATLDSIISRDRRPGEVHLGLVTFSSDYQFGLYRSQAATIDVSLTKSRSSVLAKLGEISDRPIIGNTNISAGLELVDSCRNQGSPRSLTGYKILVLMSDGIQTEGGPPATVAEGLRRIGWTIHTISYSDQADKVLMSRIAEIGGGKHYHAPDSVSLTAAFSAIAESLPGTLIN